MTERGIKLNRGVGTADIGAFADSLAESLNRQMRAAFQPEERKSLRRFSSTEVAELLRVSPSNLRNRHKDGSFPEVFTDGRGHRFYSAEDIDTLRDIRAQYPDAELFFITGADAVAEIMQWKDANKMWELAHFVAVTRPGYSSPDGVKLPEGKVDTLEIPALAISSTDVRRRAEHGEPVWYLVPDGVVQYIGKHGLYR